MCSYISGTHYNLDSFLYTLRCSVLEHLKNFLSDPYIKENFDKGRIDDLKGLNHLSQIFLMLDLTSPNKITESGFSKSIISDNS